MELRQESGLREVPVKKALTTFKEAAVDGRLTIEQFLAAYGVLFDECGFQGATRSVAMSVFRFFDRDENEVIDLMELISGMSTLCAGSKGEKVTAVFDVFDENRDGFISMEEMFKFLTAVFKVVMTPQVVQKMNDIGADVQSPEELASITTTECFKEADLNSDGKLSLAEFNTLFHRPDSDGSVASLF